jgi:HK97 gp10 family phage protein
MSGYTVKIEGLDKLEAAIKKAPVKVISEIEVAVKKSVVAIQSEAMKQAPVNKQSGGGNLRQKITSKMLSKLSGVIESMAKYSLYVEEGTRPHIIRPRNAKSLSWTSSGTVTGPRGGSKTVNNRFFARVVHHPGTQANPYMKRAVNNTKAKVDQYFRNAMERVASLFSNG